MNKLLSSLFVAMLLVSAAPPARATERVSLDFFYEHLDSYGVWREVGDYGYCWQPSDVREDWRPYSDGRWVYTDAGWTWDSDEPFGWAVYHYGRWANIQNIGWIWVPDTEWGPAWVSWRRSPAYVGWAPLPPEARFRVSIGFSSWVDDYYDIGPSSYCFVAGRNFGSRHLRSVFIDPRENITIISQTTNITNITYVDNRVYNSGPRYELLSSQSADPIRRYTLDRRQSFDGDYRTVSPEHLRSRVQGESLSVFAPTFAGGAASAPKRLAARLPQAEVNRGWRNAGSPAEVTELRAKLKGHAKTPDELPAKVKYERSTADTPIERVRRDGLPAQESRPNIGQPPVARKSVEPKQDGRRSPADQPPMVKKDDHQSPEGRRILDQPPTGKPGKAPTGDRTHQPEKSGATANGNQPPKARTVEEPAAPTSVPKAEMKKRDTKGDDSPRRIGPPERPAEAQAGSRGKVKAPQPSHVENAPPAHVPGKKQKSDNARPSGQPQQKRPVPEAKRPDPAPPPAPAVPQIHSEKGKSKPKKTDPEEDDKKPGKRPK